MIKTKNIKDMTRMLYNNISVTQEPPKVDIALIIRDKNIPKRFKTSKFVKFEEKVDNFDRNTQLYVSIYLGENGYPSIRITDTQVSCGYFLIEGHENAISSSFYFEYANFCETHLDVAFHKMKVGDILYRADFVICKGFKSISAEIKITQDYIRYGNPFF